MIKKISFSLKIWKCSLDDDESAIMPLSLFSKAWRRRVISLFFFFGVYIESSWRQEAFVFRHSSFYDVKMVCVLSCVLIGMMIALELKWKTCANKKRRVGLRWSVQERQRQLFDFICVSHTLHTNCLFTDATMYYSRANLQIEPSSPPV